MSQAKEFLQTVTTLTARKPERLRRVRYALAQAGLYPTARQNLNARSAAWMVIGTCSPTSETAPLRDWITAKMEFFAKCDGKGYAHTLDVLTAIFDPAQELDAQAIMIDRTSLAVMAHRENGRFELLTPVSDAPAPAVLDALFFPRHAIDEIRQTVAGKTAEKKFFTNKNLN